MVGVRIFFPLLFLNACNVTSTKPHDQHSIFLQKSLFTPTAAFAATYALFALYGILIALRGSGTFDLTSFLACLLSLLRYYNSNGRLRYVGCYWILGGTQALGWLSCLYQSLVIRRGGNDKIIVQHRLSTYIGFGNR